MPFPSVSTSHFDTYAARMANGMADKLFFAEHTNSDIYVDFGCSDGTLLAALKTLKPNAHMVGYDLCSQAISRAEQKVDGAFFTDWAAMEQYLGQFTGKSITLIASSVIHEVYAYGGQEAGAEFWQRLNHGPFTHFVMRDMALSREDTAKRDPDIASQVRAKADPDLLASFEAQWGSIEMRRHLAHFLLKYRYDDNWARENTENYLPITRESIIDKLRDRFDIEMCSHEILPFLADRLAEDFDTVFPCTTHFKIILRRK